MKKIVFLFTLVLLLSDQVNAQWYPQFISSEGYIGINKFTSNNIGWATSNNPAKIYKSNDGGENWNIVRHTDGPISSVYILNDSIGWYTDKDSYGCRLIGTTDGGTTWQQKFNGVYYSFDGLYFFNSLKGLAFGTLGAPASGAFFKTANGGINWETFDIGFYPYCCFFIDSLTGWCGVFPISGNNSILKTTDGGNTWSDFPSPSTDPINKIHFFNNNSGWVLSGDDLYHTSNAGIIWNLNESYINDFYFIDQNNGWFVAGDNIYNSTDAGNSWNLQHSNNGKELYTISFKDNNAGWACGDSGLVLRTVNGGIPVELTSFTSSLIDDDVTLSWQTATETNNQGFEVQRKQVLSQQSSVGNEEWIDLDFVNGNETTTEPQSYSFVDENLQAGKYQYRLKQIDFDGTFEYSNVIEVEIIAPLKFSLEQNYPNPFNPNTTINWQSPISSWQTIKLYNTLGQEVETIVNEYLESGVHSKLYIVNSTLPSGIYYYQLTAGDYIETKKMILLK
jgi:photosystem II stability/assembly factor-like uncharacterized protein